MPEIEIYKASPTKGDEEEIPSLLIQATQSVPDMPMTSTYLAWKDASDKFFVEQAVALYGGMKQSLPQGTLDRLFALMADDKASVLRVREKNDSASSDIEARVERIEEQLNDHMYGGEE